MSIALFVDAAYVYREFIRHHGRMDYPRLRAIFEERLGDVVVESHFFNAVDEAASVGIGRLHTALRKWHFIVHVGWLQSRHLHWADNTPVLHPVTNEPYVLTVQKGVDVGIAYHLMKSYGRRRWSKLVFVAGDADFEEPIADLVENEGVELHLVGVEGTLSTRLQRSAHTLHFLDHDPLRGELSERFSP